MKMRRNNVKATILSLPGPKVRITLIETKNFTTKEFSKLLDSICVLSYVLNSEEFYARIMLASFSSTKLSNKAIYEIIMNSNEALDGVIGSFGYENGDDHEIDLDLNMYQRRFSRVVGYTMPRSLTVFLNRKFFSIFKAWQVAANLFHEHTHNLGFDHSSAKDKESVPYVMGDIVEELGKKYYKEAMSLKPSIEMSIR
jgi:hypothetical protein